MGEHPGVSVRLLRAVGIGVLGMASLLTIAKQVGWYTVGMRPPVPASHFAIWIGATLVYAAGFWSAAGTIVDDRLRVRTWWLLAVQSVAALVGYWFDLDGIQRAALLLIALQLGLFVPIPLAMALTTLHGMLQIAVWTLASPATVANGLWAYSGMVLPYSILVVITTNLMGREARTKNELARVNAQLRATQALVAGRERAE